VGCKKLGPAPEGCQVLHTTLQLEAQGPTVGEPRCRRPPRHRTGEVGSQELRASVVRRRACNRQRAPCVIGRCASAEKHRLASSLGGAREPAASPLVSQKEWAAIARDDASVLWRLPAGQGCCLRCLRQPHCSHVREGHPEQRADTLCDRGRDERARQPRCQLPTAMERSAQPGAAGDPA
jgi:hypothetical protein